MLIKQDVCYENAIRKQTLRNNVGESIFSTETLPYILYVKYYALSCFGCAD